MQTSDQQIWSGVLAEIELSVSRPTFSTWFKKTQILKQEDGVVYVRVASEFERGWLVEKYHKEVLRILRERIPGIRAVEFVVSQEITPHHAATEKPSMVAVNELPLHQYYVNKEDNLNPRYMFDTFVVGPFNELAYAATQAIIKKPGVVYNPLLIYGDTGFGKTHLIQAVGNALKKAGVSRKIYYVTSEQFSNEYVESVRGNRIGSFKEKYRAYDVLIMDDVQFLSKKEKTQEELFHVYNNLYDNNKQLVFSSDTHPNFIPDVEERLVSRFKAGMTIEITKPDHESRVAMLKVKVSAMCASLDAPLYHYIAEELGGNVRELEGVVNAVVCQTQIKQRQLSIPEVKQLIKNTSRPKKNVLVEDVVRAVAAFYNIPSESINEKTRRKEVVLPRQMAMYLLREDFGVSFPLIGQKLGGRDHTTVIHSYEKIRLSLKTDHQLLRDAEQIRNMIR